MTELVSTPLPVDTARPEPRLQVLDALRFFAASLVVLFHYSYFAVGHSPGAPITIVARYGYLGVDLFFLISGFVIFNSARGKSARQFAVARAVRLYPAFWFAVALTAVVIVVGGGAVGRTITLTELIANLTMVPGRLGQRALDDVYWTLFTEIVFYALVFGLLLLRQGHRLGAFFPAWAVAMLAIAIVAPGLTDEPLLGNYYTLFACGAILAEIRQSGPSAYRVVGLGASVALGLYEALGRIPSVEASFGLPLSPTIVVGVVAVWMVAIASLCSSMVGAVKVPAVYALGAMTYPLYLLHNEIGRIVSAHLSQMNEWLLYPTLAVATCLLSYAMHVVIERRFKQFWYGFFDSTLGRVIAKVERES